ncbi:filamentous hemagglutinin N-terminal domain-containing protein [Noviherbaspirillum denitrificans]|uniref:Filamentous haemagglutinin FhaB/tRNA nuclease CdiA-like TPS domain-containing protein n=1 Tax=Noviherbaspirillum denitrificans TaxID=1968433 RepID=A0A254T866_9BURK|nr:filamentous hemagglutinin N-terminal domain-containing protein [Noviherbaspirillum denitrificans]OWW18775.1 hypothetical protein AYR66_04225 [Noviherbaspirillum denitrificans]
MNTNAAKRAQQIASRQVALRRRLLPILLGTCFGTALANPFGPQVVNGQASFLNQGNVLTVTNTPGTILNWQSFSINPGELTRFLQQNANSAVLNRITGQDPSQILGALQSNGRVFLVNPNGILFGQGAQVDVNGLVASTLNISNEDFLNGRMLFKAGDKAGNLKNEGTIATPSGGQVFLIAPNVENSGIITSPKGDVMLAAGHTVQLVDSLNPDVRVVLSAPESEALNLGQVIAQGGRTGIYGALVKQRGVINADSAVVGENGKVVLKASRDTLVEAGSRTSAKGAGKGGEIQVLGERVGLTGDAVIDASGQQGGGTVLVGGDYQGKNSGVQNAKRTYVGKDVQIKADATENGDGGKVIVWSDEVTRNYGSISARGGANGGDGGFVESSGKQMLEHRGRVDVSAPIGKGGTLLLDPAVITLVGGSGDGDGTSPDGTNTFAGAGTTGTVNFADPDLTSAGVSNIYQSELEGLAPGTNIVLESTDHITATGTFSNLVTLPNNSNLTMRTRNASTDGSGTIGINLVSSTDSVNLEFKTQGTGTITMQTGTGTSPQAANINVGKLTTNGGSVALSASGNIVVRAITTTDPSSNGGNISVTSGDFMTLGGAQINASAGDGIAGDITLNSGGDINVSNTTTITANHLKMTSVGGIHGSSVADYANINANFLNAKSTNSGSIKISNTGTNLIIYDGGVASADGVNAADGIIDIKNGASFGISVQAPVVAQGASIAMAADNGIDVAAAGPITSNGGNVTLTVSGANGINLAAGAQIASGGGMVTLTSNVINLSGSLIDASSGNVQIKPFNAAKNIDIGGAAVDGANLALSQADLAAVKTSGTLKIGDVFAVPTGAVSVVGTLDLTTPGNLTGPFEIYTSSGAVSVNAAMTVPKDLTITSGSGSIATTAPGSITAGSANTLVLKTAALSIGASIAADDIEFSTDSLTLGASAAITGSIVGISSKTAGLPITVGATCGAGCLSVTDLWKINSPVIAIGPNSAGVPYSGNLTVAGITATASSAITDRHANTTTIGLFSTGNVTQTGPIDVANLAVVAGGSVNLATSTNHVSQLAGESIGAFSFKNDQSFVIGDISGSGPTFSYSISGLTTSNSSIALTLAGNATDVMDLSAVVDAGTGTVTLDSTGSVYGSAFSPDIIAGNVSVTAAGTGGIDGAGGLHIQAPLISKLDTAAGSVDVLGFSALTVGALTPTAMTAVSAPSGSVTITTSGALPLTINGDVSAGGNINLIAGSASSSFTGNVLTINRPVTSSSGVITLGANSVGGTSVPTGPNVSLQTPGSSVPPPPPPTLDQCVSNPTLAGCTDVLPTLATCTTAPTTAGCTAVLPTVDACVANPTQAGCTAVLPTLSTCTTAPTTAGCTAVLPSISTCTTAPETAGCTAVLPTLSSCTANPTQPGCTVVLPTLSTCTAAPATAGCTAVLPTLSSCTTNPTQPGCTVVLPPLSACITSPSTAGCTAVLPTLSSCTINPAQDGCSVVLPTLSSCTALPNQPGCSAVLPALSTCTAAPTTAGCTVVLPTLAQCSAAPTLEGCSVVIPTASKCVLNPSAPECVVVLPVTDPGTGTGSTSSPPNIITETVIDNTNIVLTTIALITSNQMLPGSGSSSGGGSGSEGKKIDKKTLSSTDDSGAKKNEPVRKMYCN